MYVFLKHDTINDTKTEYRFKHIRDTIRIVRRDSIPYPVRVVETKEVARVPTWVWALFLLALLACVWFTYKFLK